MAFASDSTPKDVCKRKSYTIETKLSVLRKLDKFQGNKSKTAKICRVPRQSVQDWAKEREKLQGIRDDRSLSVKRRRKIPLEKGDTKQRGVFPLMEDEVVAWIRDLRKKGVTVSGGMIQRKARICFEELYSSETFTFKASNGWLDRFIKRQDLSCRVVTSTGQKVPSNVADLFISFVLNKRESKGLPPDAIGNMDETQCGSICLRRNHMILKALKLFQQRPPPKRS